MMRKKEVIDLQDLTADVDEEDAELLAMFPRSRERALNDMVLVKDGEEMYLERKADIAIRQKQQKAMIQWLTGLAAGICLICEFFAVLEGSRLGWLWAAGATGCILSVMFPVPANVK